MTLATDTGASEDPAAELPDAEERRVWDRFLAEFAFQPRMRSAVKEPAASAIWSLAALPGPGHERVDRLVEVVKRGPASCVGPQGALFSQVLGRPIRRSGKAVGSV
ncbi:DUF2716 domain-containing protein [Streptomyces sp. NPDC051243]|uniref:DUF2716 domain-containing protein n=1 Tax=Streptomyces sp. NPDC051243 TaxID=3365646 RepID=UPI0037B48176